MHLVKSRKTQNLSDKRKINGELSNKQDCMSEPNHKHSGLNWQMIWHFLYYNDFKDPYLLGKVKMNLVRNPSLYVLML